MKNKKNVVLLVLVMAVWGVIGFKVYQHLSEEEPARALISKTPPVVVPGKPDYYPLSFSYDDPFLKKSINIKSINVKRETIRRAVVKRSEPVVAVNWGVIKYLGVLQNNTRKSKTVALSVNNIDYFLKVGEQAEGFVLKEIYPDSIKLVAGTSFKYVKKEK